MGKDLYTTLTEENLMEEARKIVVKRRNNLVNRMKLQGMVQGGDEPITGFETRLKPVARTGRFKVKCQQCNLDVDYTDQVVLEGRCWRWLSQTASWRRL